MTEEQLKMDINRNSPDTSQNDKADQTPITKLELNLDKNIDADNLNKDNTDPPKKDVLTEEEQQIKEQEEQDKMSLKIGLLDYIFFMTKQNYSPEANLYSEGKNRIMEKMDINYIVNKLLEQEKLKQCLFDEDQQFLFEYIPKPFLMGKSVIENEDDKKEVAEEKKAFQDMLKSVDKNTELSNLKSRKDKKKQINIQKKEISKEIKKKKKLDDEAIMSHFSSFWDRKKQVSTKEDSEKFLGVINRLHKKDNITVIDKRQLQIMEMFDS